MISSLQLLMALLLFFNSSWQFTVILQYFSKKKYVSLGVRRICLNYIPPGTGSMPLDTLFHLLNFTLLICKMGVIIIPMWQGCYEDEIRLYTWSCSHHARPIGGTKGCVLFLFFKLSLFGRDDPIYSYHSHLRLLNLTGVLLLEKHSPLYAHDTQNNVSRSGLRNGFSPESSPLSRAYWDTPPSLQIQQVWNQPHLSSPKQSPSPIFLLPLYTSAQSSFLTLFFHPLFYSLTKSYIIKIPLSLVPSKRSFCHTTSLSPNLQVPQCLLDEVQVPRSSLCILPSSALFPSYVNLPLILEYNVPPTSWNSCPMMLLMFKISSSSFSCFCIHTFGVQLRCKHFVKQPLTIPALQMCCLLWTCTICFPSNTHHPALWFNSFMWSVLVLPLKWDCEGGMA